MDEQIARSIEVVNRLKRGTMEGRLLWEATGTYGKQYAAPLESGATGHLAATPAGDAVVLMITNAQGVRSLHLDTTRVTDDTLRLALLQLFVTVRKELERQRTSDALNAVRDL